jgi:hypothetical protein
MIHQKQEQEDKEGENMDEFMKLVMMAAMDDAIKKEMKKPDPKETVDSETVIAETNLKLFQAHLAVGFSREEAIKLVAANNILKG